MGRSGLAHTRVAVRGLRAGHLRGRQVRPVRVRLHGRIRERAHAVRALGVSFLRQEWREVSVCIELECYGATGSVQLRGIAANWFARVAPGLKLIGSGGFGFPFRRRIGISVAYFPTAAFN